MNQKTQKNEKLNTDEYRELLTALGNTISTYCEKQPVGVVEKINQHLTWIASLNVLTITDPAQMYATAKQVSADADLFRFYSQVDFQLFSMVSGQTDDTHVKLCKNIADALPVKDEDKFGISYNSSVGDLHELAARLYKHKWMDLIVYPSKSKRLHQFLINHRHVVLQIIIMQFYQLKSN